MYPQEHSRAYKDYQVYNLRIKGYGSNGQWSCQGHTLIFALVHRRWPRDGYHIDHIDDDTYNNHPDNLREITNYENNSFVKMESNTIKPIKTNSIGTQLIRFFK